MEDAMSDLTPEDQDLLARARGAHQPTDADRARVRAAVVASLCVGTGLTVTTAAAPAAASAMVGGVVVKILVGCAVAAGLGLGASAAFHAAHAQREVVVAAAAPIAPGPSEAMPAATLARPWPLEPTAPAPSAISALPPAVVSVPTPVRMPRAPSIPLATAPPRETSAPWTASTSAPLNDSPTAEVAAAPATAAIDAFGPALTTSAPTVEAEMGLVRSGVDALHEGDPSRALALFDEHARLYANGVLAEERAGERVIALCDLGRAADARAAATEFLGAHAHAPLAARVRASCAGANGR
jgi:hypothetical protein